LTGISGSTSKAQTTKVLLAPTFATSAQGCGCGGDVIIVGSDDAESGVGEVMDLGQKGVAMIKVFSGSVTENRFRLNI
jgi:hypothetical protein